jgi:condensin complex subunit 2
MNAFDDLRSLHSIAELTQLIGTDTSDYSYFNFDRLKLHDLPKNLKAFVLRMNTANSQSGTQQQQQQQDQMLMQPPQKVDRRRKEMPKLDLSIVLDRSKFFKVTKKAIFISDRTIENRLDKSHNLETERELDYSARKLLQPYGKNIQAKLITSDCDFENIDNLLGDHATGAAAQRPNQTINEHQAPDDNDDFDVGLGDAAGGMHDDFDMAPGTMQPFFTQNGGEFDLLTQNPSEQQPLGDLIGSGNTENIVVDGDYLIKAPEQVNPLNIDYAKTAKSIDARRLKYVMWNLICSLSNDKVTIFVC